MTIQYMQERRDFADASRAVSSKRLGTYMILFWLLLLVLQMPKLHGAMREGASFGQALQYNQAGAITLVAVAVFYLVLIWLQPVIASRRAIPRQVTWNLTDEGARIDNEVASTEMQWRAYIRFKETPKMFLLYVQKGQAHFIPKRILTANQLYELREILRAHIPE